MKRLFMMAAVSALALVSCQKDLGFEEKNAEERLPEESGVVFTATTEGSDTRTALSENEGRYNVVWRSGDRITIADGAGTPNVGEYSTTSETTSATFTKESGADPAATPYKAWYPATLYNAGAPTLPATQDYVAGNISGMPMYAESSTTALSFKNLCGIIRLNISTTVSGKKVRRIILAADQGMSGAISNAGSLEGSGYAATVSGTAGVTLDCGEGGVAISGSATPFHIAVPANTYTTLKITVVTTDGEVQTRTSNKGIAVERSKITDITLGFGSLTATTGRAAISGGGSQEWVQLWAGGPKWAKFNVGSTITSYAGVTEYNNTNVGGHYSYRGRYDNTPDAGGTDDTAKYHWGENWAAPSSTQEQALLDNCIWTYCDGSTVQYEPGCTLAGYKVSGKDAGYTENSIFLPYAGINDQNTHGVSVAGARGVYWSIDAGGSGAYYLNEGQYGESVMSHNQPHGCSVRAICVNDYEDLSASASANCYLVPSSGRYMFRATVKGNGGLDPLTGMTATTIDPANIAGVRVLWELSSQGRAIKHNGVSYDISYSDGYVYFSTPDSFVPGDACVAIYDSSDNILWSWVIWATPDPGTTTHNGKTFMDRNLGAIDVGNCMRGFLYQWGRKDAFSAANGNNYSYYTFVPAANTTFGTLVSSAQSMAYTVLNPTVRITTYPWMLDEERLTSPWRDDIKTIYDPCPEGWRVPTKTDMADFTSLPNTGMYDPDTGSGYNYFGNPSSGYYQTSTIGTDDKTKNWAYCNDNRLAEWGQTTGRAIRPVRE